MRAAALLLALIAGAGPAGAQSARSTGSGASARATAEQGPSWSSLSPAQREALKPLERDWASLDASRKRKWLEVADRYSTMPAKDQARLQDRMVEWAKLTPAERNQARLQYNQAKQVPAQDRQASWEAYQALPEEKKRALANRGAPAAGAGTASGAMALPGTPAPRSAPEKLTREGPQPKVNAVPATSADRPPKAVAPSVVQAQPGATTTLISKPPAPPPHQPSGSPKIAATPEYVDKKTLLPHAGAQSVGPARPAAAQASAARP
jgi:hypothetical protein